MAVKVSDKAKQKAAQQKYIADQSQATLDSQNQMIALANGGNGWQTGAQNAVAGITNGSAFGTEDDDVMRNLMGGVNFGTNTAASGINQFANGSYVGSQPGMGTLTQGSNFTNAAGGLQQQQAQNLAGSYNPAQSMLSQTASGAYLNGSPYLQSMIDNANSSLLTQFKDVTNPGLNSQASMTGRNGSGAAALLRNKAEDTLASNMTKNATDMIGANYAQERDRQMAAQNSIGNFYNTDQQNQMAANSALAGTSAQQQQIRNDSANSLNSANQFDRSMQYAALADQQGQYNQDIQNKLANAGMQMNAANSYAGNQNAQAQAQMQAAGMAGGMRQLDYMDPQMLAQVGAQQDARNTAQLQADMARFDAKQNKDMNQISQLLSLYQGGGYNNVTQPVQQPNMMGQAIGGLTSLLGLFAMSDENTKIVFECVGENALGVPMYRWAYKSNPEKKFIGPMAQDVEKYKPEAVIEVAGIKLVDASVLMEGAI